MSEAGRGAKALTFRSLSLFESRHPADQNLSRHLHLQPYFSILIRGFYRETCGASTWDCVPGQAIFHPPCELHSDQFSGGGGELLNLEILPPFEEQLLDGGFRMDSRTLLHHPGCFEMGLQLRRELRASDTLSGLALEALAMEMVTCLLRGRFAQTERQQHWINRVGATLRERFRTPPTLAELAQMAHVHPVHVARTFRERFQCSVGEYVRMLRLDAACRQLRHTDRPIAEIAAEAGFADQSHLSRAVKRYKGVSPLSLRRASSSQTRLTKRTGV
jgi:AraC family transcriptional regulator